jgi:hypothetical protein
VRWLIVLFMLALLMGHAVLYDYQDVIAIEHSGSVLDVCTDVGLQDYLSGLVALASDSNGLPDC